MFFKNGLRKTPWWIELETDDAMISINHTGKPFVGTEFEKDMWVEALQDQCRVQGVDLKEVHVWPLAWAEVAS